MKLTIYIDGKYLKVSPKIADAFTPGVFYAQGVFETMLAVEGRVPDLKEHLARAYKGSGIKVAAAVVHKVVKANGFPLARVRVLVWKEGRQTHTVVMALKYQSPSKKMFRACAVQTNRPANARMAHTKSLDYALFADTYQQALAQGYDEALLLNNKGHIFEASRANIFWVSKGVLYTPPLSSGCLAGITRERVIQYAKAQGIPFKERNLTVKVLQNAGASFLTNSLIGIKPIIFIA